MTPFDGKCQNLQMSPTHSSFIAAVVPYKLRRSVEKTRPLELGGSCATKEMSKALMT